MVILLHGRPTLTRYCESAAGCVDLPGRTLQRRWNISQGWFAILPFLKSFFLWGPDVR